MNPPYCFSYRIICLLFSRYGFVEFEDTRDADDAVYELNGKELCGERVIVEHARGPRRDRDGYGGGYWGGGRSEYRLMKLSARLDFFILTFL